VRTADLERVTPLRALAVVLASAALLTGCGGGTTAEHALTLEGLAQAAATTSEASTGRFTFGMDMTAPDGYETITFSGYGAFDSAAEQSEMSLDMSSFASFFGAFGAGSSGAGGDLTDPELWKIDAVLDGLVMYMRFPLLSRLPDAPFKGKDWVKIDLRRAAGTAGFDLDQLKEFTSNDPRDMLRMLQAVGGELQELGEEELHRVDTTHYGTTVDLLRYKKLFPPSQREKVGSMLDELVKQSGLREIPVEVWVDEDSLVHKMTMTMSATQPGTGQSFEASMRFELYDYGEPVDIDVPARSAVFDVTKLG
jgi:hypothetical protein